MTDLLLITDVPRLLQVFSRLSGERGIRLRIATSLERGAEELLEERPAIVFVQTHLSGLSAEILLMHLKKQLGRRRSRFVLLSPADQVSQEALKLYQGHLDTAMEDDPLATAALDLVRTLLAPKPKKTAPATAADTEQTPERVEPVADPVQEVALASAAPAPVAPDEAFLPATAPAPAGESESSLEEQGVVYGRRQMSVYSEFTNSFDTAVSSMPAPEEPLPSAEKWEHQPPAEPSTPSRSGTFLLWLAPVLIAVIFVTWLQHRAPKTAKVAVAVTPSSPGTPQKQPPVPPPVAPAPAPAAAPAPAPAPPAAKAPAAGGAAATPADLSHRPTALPDFVPRDGRDRSYPASNPGWERYKGRVTEFKIFRENGAIKAIQVIDRGGRGIPEAFMKAAIRQLTPNPSFAAGSSEQKGGYIIQRGQVSDRISSVFYRDVDGGLLRAFVVTWQ